MSSSTGAHKQDNHQKRTNMLETTFGANDDQIAQPLQVDTGRLMEYVHEVARQYQLRSASHFELDIKVQQNSSPYLRSESNVNRSPSTLIDILFHGNSVEGRITVPVQCHIQGLRRRFKREQWKYMAISHHKIMEGLDAFLASTFSVIDAPLQADTLWRWWLSNGKSFKWAVLPTELKERIIEHCMHQPHTYGLYNDMLTRFDQRYRLNPNIRRPGPFEVVDQLGDWFPILYVSHQVRAITLRLCMVGGSNLTYSKGLCLTTSSYNSLRERIDRLSQYYQMNAPSAIPRSPTEEALSKTYGRFPRMYPHLKRYATLRHGIQKISFSMDFFSFMQFFKVTVGGFEKYHRSDGLTYEVFEQLPSLNEIVIRLPLRPNGGWRHRPQAGGPRLWHEDLPCPKLLHRIICERIAKVLAAYKVTVRNFLNEEERQMYEEGRLRAVKALKFTERELEELYAETDGGIQLLEDEKQRSVQLTRVRRKMVEEVDDAGPSRDGFFPPLCHCKEPCILSPVLLTRAHHP